MSVLVLNFTFKVLPASRTGVEPSRFRPVVMTIQGLSSITPGGVDFPFPFLSVEPPRPVALMQPRIIQLFSVLQIRCYCRWALFNTFCSHYYVYVGCNACSRSTCSLSNTTFGLYTILAGKSIEIAALYEMQWSSHMQ